MEACSVIKALDVTEAGGGGLISAHELPAINQLVFERTPTRLHRGVVEVVAIVTHGRHAAIGIKSLPIGYAGVLASAVGMVQNLADKPTLPQRHVQYSQRHRVVHT